MKTFQEFNLDEATQPASKDKAIHTKWAAYHKRAAKVSTGVDKENHENAAKAHAVAKDASGDDADDLRYKAHKASMKCFQES